MSCKHWRMLLLQSRLNKYHYSTKLGLNSLNFLKCWIITESKLDLLDRTVYSWTMSFFTSFTLPGDPRCSIDPTHQVSSFRMFAVIARFTNRSCLFPSVIQSYFSPLAGSPNKCFLLHKTSSSGTRHVIWSQGKLETVDQGQQWQNRLSSPNHRTTRPSTHFATTPFSLIFFFASIRKDFFFYFTLHRPPLLCTPTMSC